MSKIILHILCEGQTEERFVNKVMKPYLAESGIVVKSILLQTSKKSTQRGGIAKFGQVKCDLNIMNNMNIDSDFQRHYFTTMIDLYALPSDAPGFKTAMKGYELADSIERTIFETMKMERLIPYLQVHEFEALVYCGLEHLFGLYPKCKKGYAEQVKVLAKVGGNPELINGGGYNTAPCHRLEAAIAPNHYSKPQLGEYVTSKVGIEALRGKCPHFNQWIERILSLR